MRPSTFAISLGLGLLLALPASANFDIKAKLICYDSAEGTTKLDKSNSKNDAVVAACLGVAETDPSVDDYSLTFDSDANILHVIRNCDSLEICALSSLSTCADATKASETNYKTKRQCIFSLIDFGENDLSGSMVCKQNESYNVNTDKFKFKTSCNGNADFNGLACTIKFNSGKLFDESGTCPAPI